MNRRTLMLGGLAAVGATVAGGWYVFLREDPIRFEATEARVSEVALGETGYREAGVESVVIIEEFSAGGETARVEVQNWMAEYHRAIELPVLGEQEAAVFVAFVTPEVGVLGRNFNPVEDMDPDDLVELIQDEYDDLRNLERVDSDSVTVLGEGVEAVRFEGEATFMGEGIAIYLHITQTVLNDGDFVVALGVYPQLFDEAGNVFALMQGVEHPAAAEPDPEDEDADSDADEPSTDDEEDADDLDLVDDDTGDDAEDTPSETDEDEDGSENEEEDEDEDGGLPGDDLLY